MKFADVTPDKLDPEPAGFARVNEATLDPEPTEYTPGESFVLNAQNLFGAGPVIQGVLHSLTGPGSYEQWRDAYRKATEEASAQNPKSALAGKGLGVAVEAGLGGAVGKLAAGGAKAVGLASKAAPFVKANPLITSVLESGLGGAAYGAASGGGEAASKGEDVLSGAAHGAEGGAVVGGAFGALAGGITKAARGAIERADTALVPGVTDVVGGAERSSVVSALRKDPELRKLASKPAGEAIEALNERASKLSGKADEFIAQIDAKTGGISIGKFARAIDEEISQLGKTPLREQYVKALEAVKDSAFKSWVPDDLSALLNSPAARESKTGLAENLLKRRDAMPIPLAKIEELARDVPKNLPGTPEVKAHVTDILRSVRDAHLTDAIAKNPEIKSAADSLRDLDRDFEVINTITGALKSRPATDHGGLGKLISLFTHHGPVGAGLALASGHPIPAAVLAAPAAARKGTELLAFLQREAAAGNAKAIRIIKAADVARTVGTAGAGVVGSAQSGTLESLAGGNPQ